MQHPDNSVSAIAATDGELSHLDEASILCPENDGIELNERYENAQENPNDQQAISQSALQNTSTAPQERADADVNSTPAQVQNDTHSTPSVVSVPASISNHSIFTEWRWELFTWLLGTLATATILGILLYYKDRSLHSWHSKVQIGATVAIFSQFAQSALVVSISACIGQSKWVWIRQKQLAIEVQRFDEASRGPEGSLKLFVLGVCSPKARRLLSAQS